MDDATRAAGALWNEMTPLQQATSKQAEWSQRLNEVLNDENATTAEVEAAKRRYAYWTGEVSRQQGQLDGAAQGVNGTLATQKRTLDELTGSTVAADSAEAAFWQEVDRADGALQGMSGSVLDATGKLNLKSEAGRTAQGVLAGVRDRANDVITSMVNEGATAEQVVKKDAELRKSFIETAKKMGVSEQAAYDLANRIYGIPAERNTRITADVSQANGEVDKLVDKIKNAGGRVIYTEANVRNTTGVSARATGGIIHGPGTGTSDSILGIDAGTGQATSWVSAGEFVVNKRATDENRQLIEAINAGRVSQRDLPYFAKGGVLQAGYSMPVGLTDATKSKLEVALAEKYNSAGSGALGAAWGSVWQIVKAAIPQARINSTYRPGDPGYHGRGKAIDFGFGSGPGGAGSAGLASIARFLYRGYGRTLAELIYDGIGDDTPDVKNGRDHTYNAATRAQHANHVHAAVYHNGTDYVPQTGWAYLEKGEAVVPAAVNSREFSGAAGGGAVSIDYDRLAAAVTGKGGPMVNVENMVVPKSETPYETAEALAFMARNR
jgi:hypothetical protein